VRGLQDVIDPHIAAAAPAFPVDQLPAIDRNVLRLAIYELLRETDVPVKAAINEAVELAKRFGGDSSGRFVNGVLGTVAERIGAEGRRDGETGRRGDGETGRRGDGETTKGRNRKRPS
jgi:N utilization substance protein B